ncbi:MAG: hypothetical protein KA004_18710 [Verrucomicrobiales bacterium]|nr:hypothetical protein [Verrucomicrobiales bacterium]
MQRLTENRIILVVRRTRLEDLIAKFNTLHQAKFYVEHLGADFRSYEEEHATYVHARETCEAALARCGRVSVVERSFLPNFLFHPADTVVVLGQDGTVANTLKYLDRQPCLGVNPDPARWDGVLLPFLAKDLVQVIPEVFDGRQPLRSVTFARADLNTGESLLAVNDIFVGPSSHISARYAISFNGISEHHSSSGLIVSTGLGSTGWFKSLVQGAVGLASGWGGTSGSPPPPLLPWDSPQLYFTVREPFPSRSSQANLLFGAITRDAPLELVSEMPANGVIFSDGIEKDFLAFNNGAKAVITALPGRGMLVGR